MMETNVKPASEKKPNEETGNQAQVRWDTSQLKSSYANVCNATTTREEVVLNFGVNDTWERNPREMMIQLTHRIILSPFAAKRLAELLNKLMGDYETKYGPMKP